MSTLADDSQRPSAGGDGRKARSKSIRLSRGTTVSSRMRDAYVDQETYSPTRTEWELMSTLADDSQRPSAGGDGRKARSKSIRLSRGTTVSSRMRDAYVDQETFRGRYGKMLAQYSSMQSLVHELQRELLQLSHSHGTQTEPVRADQQPMEVILPRIIFPIAILLPGPLLSSSSSFKLLACTQQSYASAKFYLSAAS